MKKILNYFKLKLVVLLLVMAGLAYGDTINTTIPNNFYYHKDNLSNAVDRYLDRLEATYFTRHNWYPYFSSLIEHESCVTLTSSKCWSSKSELNTKWPNGLQREQGIGFGQITRAYTQTGSLRLDVLSDLKRRYPSELNGLTWNNIKDQPELQLRAIILLWSDNYLRLPNHISDIDRVAMADSAYNGGYGYILKDRKTCGLKANCDPDLWFNNVETINNRGNKVLYGNRTANMINRHHVRDVILERMGKYYTVDWD